MKRNTTKIVLVLVVLSLWSVMVFAGGQDEKEAVSMGTAIRTLENPYHATWAKGADAFAEATGGIGVVQTCEGSSEKQVNDIKALIAKSGGNAIFNIDPNESPNVIPIAKALEDAGIYYVTWWNKPEEVKVWDYPHWVAHIAFDGISTGEYTAQELFKTFDTPGKGKIIALQGMLANSIAKDRFQGLLNVLDKNPGVELAAYESAEWDRTKAFEKTTNMLVAHPDIDGIWTANDNMALGALEALRAAGLAGKVLVTGADGIEEMINAIDAGEAAATVYNDSYWQGGIGLSMALAAKEGKLDVASMPKSKRQFFARAVEVNQDSVKDFIANYIDSKPDYDWNDFDSAWVRAME